MENKADELPGHREEDPDHQINLVEDKEPLSVRNYKPMSEQELETSKKYISEHMNKASSVHSTTVVTPVLLVRKSGRGLRFRIGYQAFERHYNKEFVSCSFKNRWQALTSCMFRETGRNFRVRPSSSGRGTGMGRRFQHKLRSVNLEFLCFSTRCHFECDKKIKFFITIPENQ